MCALLLRGTCLTDQSEDGDQSEDAVEYVIESARKNEEKEQP